MLAETHLPAAPSPRDATDVLLPPIQPTAAGLRRPITAPAAKVADCFDWREGGAELELSRLMYRARIGEYVDSRIYLRSSFRERKETKTRARSPHHRPVMYKPKEVEPLPTTAARRHMIERVRRRAPKAAMLAGNRSYRDL
uniref:Uncharacterized protein n=1 Tax=Pyramimonas obovata TaxID=1411642 RepID=A0A7S0QUB8_9CHLO